MTDSPLIADLCSMKERNKNRKRLRIVASPSVRTQFFSLGVTVVNNRMLSKFDIAILGIQRRFRSLRERLGYPVPDMNMVGIPCFISHRVPKDQAYLFSGSRLVDQINATR